jgi:hypothetical protein
VHVQLAPVSDQRVALEAVDVNARNRDFGAGRRHAAEVAGVSAGESASRYAMGPVDEDFFDDVVAVRKFSLTASSIESATKPAISV